MDRFISKYSSHLVGTLSGFDRLVLRGLLRRLSFTEGVWAYLWKRQILLKDFGAHVHSISQRIKRACIEPLDQQNVPVKYLPSASTSKEELAREIAQERGVRQGPICLLTSIEVAPSFEIYRNRDRKKLELVSRFRKCLHLYRYEIHPVFGFMHTRFQTWFPFGIQVCLNGREWLGRQLDQEELAYVRRDNCFLHLADFERAQELLEEQLRVHWPELLNALVPSVNPLHEELFGDFCPGYYWSVHQSEWASDLVFSEPGLLRRLYPKLIQHGMTTLASPDVLRFLGRKLGPQDRIPPQFLGEVTSDMKTRAEGVRLKHRVNGNAVKVYDKAYSADRAVLRVETTVNQVQDFQVYRPKEGTRDGEKDWRPLRKGIADLHRRAQVSQGANARYLNALASVEDEETLEERLQRITQPTHWKGNRVRALQPFAPEDTALLAAVSRGEFVLGGFRNRDLRRLLFGGDEGLDQQEVRRRSGRVTRQLRLLRAHGLIQKIQKTHRYQVTAEGRHILTAILTARRTPVAQLLKEAA